MVYILMKRRNHNNINNKINKKPINNKRALFIGLIIAAVAVSGFFAVFLYSAAVHNVNTNNNTNNYKNNDEQATKSSLIKEISNPTYTNAPALGSNKAKVIMVEFGDYQCHFCARFHRDTKDSIIQNFEY